MHPSIKAAEEKTCPNPSDAQVRAGNYAKGKFKAHGFTVSVETPCGAFRRGVSRDGKPWQVRMPATYGYILGTVGADKDHLDVYVGPHMRSSKVFVLDQNDAETGKFDETKIFFGFASPRHVLNTYRKAFSDGKADQRLGAVTEMSVDQFRDWLKTGDTTKPMHRASGGRVGYAEGGDVMDLGGEGNFLTRLGEMEFSPGTAFGNRLFGTGTEERYQTWPEKMIRSGATLPGDVAAGKFDTQPAVPGQWSDEDEARRLLDQQELLMRAQDTAGMAGGTAFGAADSSVASLGAGPIRQVARQPFLEAAVRVGDRLYKGIDHLDALSKVPPEQRQAAAFDGNNRGWVNDRGRFLNREKAQQYAVTNDLIREDAPSWVATAPEAVAEWIKPRGNPETLLSDSGKPGSAIAGARRAQLPMDEASRMARAAEQGFEGPWYHGGLRMDRFTESGKIDPKRATSGPMPYFTDNPEMASAYAMGKKPDTSLVDEGRVADYFTVHPKDLGWSGRRPIPVEDTWRFLSPEQRAEIAARAKRIGYEKPNEASGPLTLHPEGARDVTLSDSHYDWILNNEARGNHLAALREMWHDSGEFVNDPGQLSEVYRLAGYPHQISETTAPWTEARGVTPARIRMTNPLDTTNTQVMTERVLPRLEEMFKRDRSRKQEFGADMWDKNHRYTPKEWIEQAKQDYASGENSYVWTSIPDKITNALRSLGYDGILDTGGKMGGMGHTVAIPFGPEQVRSQFARFDPKNLGKSGLLLEDAAAPGAPLSALEKAPPFFSAVERAVDALPQSKMTGDQWLGTLSNKPGVKPEELQWTGLGDFLAERKGQPVTKAEIAEHLADNQVRLNEVWKGADPEALAKAQALAKEHGWESWDALSPVDRQRYMQRVRGNRLTDEVPGDTKYHQYQLPGGENYREMLMTLPSKDQLPPGYKTFQSENGTYGVEFPNGSRLDGWRTEADAIRSQSRQNGSPQYTSSHWDEPNIVAHMRMNDRSMSVPFTPEETAAIEARRAAQGEIDNLRAQQAEVGREITATVKPLEQARRAQIIADNKAGKLSNGDAMRALEEYHHHPEIEPLQERLQDLRAQESRLLAGLPAEPKPRQARSLHLEEIQSDWHQQGREKGYNTGKVYMIRNHAGDILPEPRFTSEAQARAYIDERPGERLNFSTMKPAGGVPDAPFKKTWHELALKRALREAAEKGYDRLSWTPGDAQAARYDLSKQVDKIGWAKRSDGTYDLTVDLGDRGHAISHDRKTPEQLRDLVGKEIADKITADKGQKINISGYDSAGELSGEGLKIGGEGMRGFYDQIIPKALEKLTKGHGVKVQRGEIAGAYSDLKVVPRDGKFFVEGASINNPRGFDTRAAAENAIKNWRGPDNPVWYIDIPQSLKDQARGKGFALFQDSAIGAPLAGSEDDMKRATGGRARMADGGVPAFDPNKPFEPVEPAFDPSQPFDEVKPDAGAMSAAGRGAYQGATFGFGDELRGIGEAGGVKPDEWNDPISVMRGAYRYWTGAPGSEEAYEAGAKREREANKLAKEQHPYAYMGGEFAGALPSMAALPGGMAARGATLAARMRQGALVGSEYGALTGAGEGEDTASRGIGAGTGAVAGGAGGALAAPLTEGAGYLLKRTLGPVWNSVVGLSRGSEAEAARRLFNAAEADSADIAAGKMAGLTPAQWQAAKAAGEPVTLADFGGTRVQSLLRSAANTSPEARGTLEKAFGDRFEGQAERVARDVRGLVSGGANAHKTADQLVAEYDVARIPAYRRAFSQPGAQGMWDDEFAQMAQAPVVQQAIRMATVNGRNEAAKLGLKPPVNPFQFNRDGTVALSNPNFTPNLQFWDVVKKNLDKMGADGNAWSKVLRGKLDEAVPEYGNARGIAAQFFGERDALEAGRQLAGKRMDPQVVSGLMRKMSPEEKDLFREGFASDWAGRVIGGFRDSRDITKAMFNSPNEREMARVIFGDAGVRKLEARMTLEAVMDGARKAMGNSTTARQLIEAGLAGGALGGYLDGDWKGALAGAAGAAGARRALASEMAAGARKLIGKVDSATAARVADLLTSDDPRKLAQGMRIMVSNQKVADGMRALADRLANAGQETSVPRLHIDTTGWGGSLPARADQNQDQPQGLGNQ